MKCAKELDTHPSAASWSTSWTMIKRQQLASLPSSRLRSSSCPAITSPDCNLSARKFACSRAGREGIAGAGGVPAGWVAAAWECEKSSCLFGWANNRQSIAMILVCTLGSDLGVPKCLLPPPSPPLLPPICLCWHCRQSQPAQGTQFVHNFPYGVLVVVLQVEMSYAGGQFVR